MRSNERRGDPGNARSLSLVLPLTSGTILDETTLTTYRRLLEEGGAHRSVELVVAGAEAELSAATQVVDGVGFAVDGVTLVSTGGGDWDELARAGLSVAAGDHLMVLDVKRHYAAESLLGVLEPVASGRSELAVAVPPGGGFDRLGLVPLQLGLGLASRMVLGSSDVFSGLFVLRRSLWERGGRLLSASGSSLVLELLLRRPSRCVDVPAAVGPEFRRQRFQFQDLRPLKHVLDGAVMAACRG